MLTGKYLEFFTKLIRAKITGKQIPLIAVLGVTNHCNLNCWYCYGQHYAKNDSPDFSTEEILEIITGLHKKGTQILQLQGGEPLLRKDLDLIVNEAKRLGMVCDMVTNGLLITQKLDIVKQLDKICISLDGPKEITDKNRGDGVFQKIIEGISAAQNINIPVRLSAVLTEKTTKDHIDWLIDFCKRNHLLINFAPSFEFISQIESRNTTPHEISEEHLIDLLTYIAQNKTGHSPVQFTKESYLTAARWPLSFHKRKVLSTDKFSKSLKHPKCFHGDYVVFIDGDGSVYPCCNFWGEPCANVLQDGVQDSLNKLTRKGCLACYIPAYIDRNLFFSGSPKAWWNYFKQTIRGKI